MKTFVKERKKNSIFYFLNSRFSQCGLVSHLSAAKGEGFTLIDTLIYITLLSLTLGFLVPAFFQLLSANAQTRARLEVEIEGRFLTRKIEWALLGAQTVIQPASGATSSVLSLAKYNFSANPLVFDSASGAARLSRGGGAPVALTNSGVQVSQLLFQHAAASGTVPDAVTVSFSIASLRTDVPRMVSSTFQSTIYFRK